MRERERRKERKKERKEKEREREREREIEGVNTKWRFYRLTNSTMLALSVKDVAMGCRDEVLAEIFLKNQTVSCLTFKETTKDNNKSFLFVFQ